MKPQPIKSNIVLFDETKRGEVRPINTAPLQRRVCIAVPTTGLIRMEWAMSRWGVIIPVNWSHGDIFQFYDQITPYGYSVADARNICVEYAVSGGFEWLLFIDNDTLIPQNTLLKMGDYMRDMKYPVVCGLYYCKGSHPEPLVFRGRGTGYYDKWKFGDIVKVDGVPMGCTLIHMSLIKKMYEESEIYTIQSFSGPVVVRRVFETPKMAWTDPETGKYNSISGTEDLPWCDRVIREGYLEKAGWSELAKEKYPFIIDTEIFCQHIDNNGIRYPGYKYREYNQYKGSKLEAKENQGYFPVAKTQGSHYEGSHESIKAKKGKKYGRKS